MKSLLISICLLFLSYGCSKDTPTAPVPTLDTTTKEDTGNWTINRYDDTRFKYVETADKINVSWTWRFISHLDLNEGGVKIKGGYTLEVSNPIDDNVKFSFSKLSFEDKTGIPFYEYDMFLEGSVSANRTRTYSGAFEIELDNIDTANQITRMALWGSARITL